MGRLVSQGMQSPTRVYREHIMSGSTAPYHRNVETGEQPDTPRVTEMCLLSELALDRRRLGS